MSAFHKYGHRCKDWQPHYWSLVTVRNMLSTCMHGIARARFWLEKAPWFAYLTMEDAIEEHYGHLKVGFTGHPQIKDAITATHLKHMKQCKVGFQSPKRERYVKPFTEHSLTKIARTALRSAVILMSLMKVGVSPPQVLERLQTWWNEHGAFIMKVSEVP